MLRIGLTGGIGCGKSSVCELFRKLGAPIVDTDVIARQLVEPGSAALGQIAATFGGQLIKADGSLDRVAMRELVFRDDALRQQLEALLHPLIREEMERQLAALDTPYVIIAIPLLVEKGWQSQLERVVVVDCSETQQLQRTSERDASTAETITRIIASQASRSERLAVADDIIDNSGPRDALRAQVEALHRRYLALAAGN